MIKYLDIIKKHRVGACAIAVVAIFLYALLLAFRGSKHSNLLPKVVETELVEIGDFRKTEKFIGTVKPKNYCVVTSRSAGIINSVAEAGSFVRKGDIIAHIENLDIEKTYDLCAAAEKISRDQYERAKTLGKSGASSKGSIEDKEKAWIDSQKALAIAKIEFDNINIKAPFDGEVGVYKVRDGEHIQPFEQIVSFYNTKVLIVDFGIPIDIAKRIRDGQAVSIAGKQLKLKHIQRVVDEETHMCPAYIELSNTDNTLVVGSSVNLEMVTHKKSNVCTVSSDAVFLKNGETFVYVINNSKVADIRKVKTGAQEKEKIEILAGVKNGEEVISIGQDRIYPGMPVIMAGKEITEKATP